MIHLKSMMFCILCCGLLNANAQQDSTKQTMLMDTMQDPLEKKTIDHEIYRLRLGADIPIVALTAGWSAFAFTKIYSKEASTEQEILNLDRNDIPKFDRWAAGMNDENADANSNYLFYGTIPVPFLLLLDKPIRQDGWKVYYLYLEAMSITGLFYTGSVYLVDRYRPQTYDTSVPVKERTGGNYKDAFLAGHPALVATGLFFTAKVYSDYHPESGFRYVLFGLAAAGTGATAYLRHIAGKHFPSDLLAGITVGTLSGILVPQFHKQHESRNSNIGFVPMYDGRRAGFAFCYRFH